MAHLTRGSDVCLLNLVARTVPYSVETEAEQREIARQTAVSNRKQGDTLYKANCPAFRLPWVCNALYDLQGNHVLHGDKRHPWTTGAGKVSYGWKTDGVEYDVDDHN